MILSERTAGDLIESDNTRKLDKNFAKSWKKQTPQCDLMEVCLRVSRSADKILLDIIHHCKSKIWKISVSLEKGQVLPNCWLAALYPHWRPRSCNPGFPTSCSAALSAAVTMCRLVGKLSVHRHPSYRQLGKLSSRVINRAAVKHGFSNKWSGTCSHIPPGLPRSSHFPWGSAYGHIHTLKCHGPARYWGHICDRCDAFLFFCEPKMYVRSLGK